MRQLPPRDQQTSMLSTICGAGFAYIPRAPDIKLVMSRVCSAQCLVLFVVLCKQLFAYESICFSAMVLSVCLRLMSLNLWYLSPLFCK